MELRITFPMLSMLSFGIFHTASLGEASLSARHYRTKRCSCATFLDKECIYFCHLDIIWVNTPERTVSYGLGNAPRKKRSTVQEAPNCNEPSRCYCTNSNDDACWSFCHRPKPLRCKATRDKVIPTAAGHDCAKKKCKYSLAAKTRGIKRADKRTDPSSARAAPRLHPLLEKWRVRWPSKTLAWATDS
ncbi:endothelin-1 [Trichomycterus rosablanca]|uniref:endothelin-1 n=1 Tax=Trichomycterus rosablanca TaxID=2290929 RepID=UPI002F351134